MSKSDPKITKPPRTNLPDDVTRISQHHEPHYQTQMALSIKGHGLIGDTKVGQTTLVHATGAVVGAAPASVCAGVLLWLPSCISENDSQYSQ